jgi:hypothetical protein
MLAPIQHVVFGDPLNEDVRTEDVKFSPSGEMMAVVSTNGMVFFFAVDTQSRPVHVRQSVELRSRSLKSPHGIAFLSEAVVAIANRRDAVTFYRVPDRSAWSNCTSMEPVHRMDSQWFGGDGITRKLRNRNINTGPGSIRAHGNELFVCCNNANTVSAHPF